MDPVQELKNTCEELGRAVETMRAEQKSQISKGVADALSEVKIDRVNKAIDDLIEQKEKVEARIKAAEDQALAIERKVNDLKVAGGGKPDSAIDLGAETKAFNDQRRSFSKTPVPDVTIEDYTAYKSAWDKFARRGEHALSMDERKALQAGVDSDGGYTLPPPTAGRIVSRVFDLSPIRQISSVQALNNGVLEGLNDNDEASYGWVGETGARSTTNTPTVGKYRIEAFEMYAAPKASQTIIDDSGLDIESWLAGKVADRFARVEGAAFCVGTGVGQPKGFASYTTAATADATRAWGQLEHVKTGANGAFHTTQADPLFGLIQAFKSAYLQNARFVTTREVIAAIRKFKTTTTLEYIWQPGLQQGAPQMLLGYPVVIAQDMPALATGSLSLALGDFREGYQVVDRLGVRTLRDPYTDKPYVVFYSTKRVGGGVLNFEAIKFLQFAS